MDNSPKVSNLPANSHAEGHQIPAKSRVKQIDSGLHFSQGEFLGAAPAVQARAPKVNYGYAYGIFLEDNVAHS